MIGLSTKITGIAAILMIAAVLFFWNRDHVEQRKENTALKSELKTEKAWHAAALTAMTYKKETTDTLSGDELNVKYVYHQVDSMEVYYTMADRFLSPVSDDDTNVVQRPIVGLNRTFAGTFTTSDFEINWRLLNGPTGRLLSITPGDYKVYRKKVETSHVLEIEKEVPVEYKKNHLYIELAAGNPGHKWTEWTSFDAYLTYMVKNRWGIGTGYQRWNSDNLFKVKVSLMLL